MTPRGIIFSDEDRAKLAAFDSGNEIRPGRILAEIDAIIDQMCIRDRRNCVCAAARPRAAPCRRQGICAVSYTHLGEVEYVDGGFATRQSSLKHGVQTRGASE